LFKIVDFGVSLLYMRKGMMKEKRRADKFIKTNKNYISKRYFDLQRKRKLEDHEIIKKFSDNITLPKDSFEDVSILNEILKKTSKLMKSII